MPILYGTPLSHFARKNRILLDLYEVDYEFLNIGEVGSSSPANFANNPLMKVPTYLDDENWIIDSDTISHYIVKKYDSMDRYNVLTEDFSILNARAILNGIMQEEVKLILAHRTGVPTEQYVFFDKSRKTIEQGLQWLEQRAELFNKLSPTYLDFHLLCLWEHLSCYKFSNLDFKNLRKICEHLGQDATLHKTSPYHTKPKLL